MISVITIARNCESVLERTILSVINQNRHDIQYIFIDGASTDGTVNVATKYKDKISVFVSEPDKGISDAWNKALKLATGDVIALLNAGDEYYPDTLTKAVAAIDAGADMVYGDTELVSEAGEVRLFNKGKFHLWKYSSGVGLYHPSVVARKSLYDRIGGFELRQKYAMDTDWMIRAAVSGAKIQHAGYRVRMLDGGVSVKNRFLAYGEHMQALQDRGAGERTVYLSMLATGLRGLVRNLLRGDRQF
ncbi:MAG: glycosyltransferase family 2 protein [Aquabacterium sp.]|nr:glycosyltransferase family 2 protein [Aquabacterium sp.]